MSMKTITKGREGKGMTLDFRQACLANSKKSWTLHVNAKCNKSCEISCRILLCKWVDYGELCILWKAENHFLSKNYSPPPLSHWWKGINSNLVPGDMIKAQLKHVTTVSSPRLLLIIFLQISTNFNMELTPEGCADTNENMVLIFNESHPFLLCNVFDVFIRVHALWL